MGFGLPKGIGNIVSGQNPLMQGIRAVSKFLTPGAIDFAKTWSLQREYLWDVMLPPVEGYTTDHVHVSQYCQNIDFGDWSFKDGKHLRVGEREAKYPGRIEIKDITMSFIIPVPDIVGIYFKFWRKLIQFHGNYFPKVNYAKTIYATMYDVTGSISTQYTLLGVWPKEFQEFKLNYKREEVLIMDFKLSVDDIVLTHID